MANISIIGPAPRMPTISGDEFRVETQCYVIAEMWDRIGFGRGRREWAKNFTIPDRVRISFYAKKFRRWQRNEGMPNKVFCPPQTIQLLQRAAAFFASLD